MEKAHEADIEECEITPEALIASVVRKMQEANPYTINLSLGLGLIMTMVSELEPPSDISPEDHNSLVAAMEAAEGHTPLEDVFDILFKLCLDAASRRFKLDANGHKIYSDTHPELLAELETLREFMITASSILYLDDGKIKSVAEGIREAINARGATKHAEPLSLLFTYAMGGTLTDELFIETCLTSHMGVYSTSDV